MKLCVLATLWLMDAPACIAPQRRFGKVRTVARVIGVLQRKQKQLLDPVTQSIQAAISAVARESGYDFILNAGAGRNDVVLFAVERSDVSDLVLQKMGVQTPVR